MSTHLHRITDSTHNKGGKATLLTERIQLAPSQCLSRLCHNAKNLYNLSNYNIRQAFIHERRWMRYREIYDCVKITETYKRLPAQTAQQVLRRLDQNWVAFFVTLKDWKLNSGKQQWPPRPPRYKPKNGEFLVVFTNQQCHIRNGTIFFPKKAQLSPIKTRITEPFQKTRIVPQGNHYIVEIVYYKSTVNSQLNPCRVLSIDLGLNNLVTVVNNAGLQPWRVKGGVVKSINQYYNKVRSRLSSLQNQQGLTGSTRRLRRLQLKRYNKITDIFHKVSRRIITYCVAHNIGRIVVGYNTMWKQRILLGRRTNQNFVSVPFQMLVRQIHYKAALVGIKVILVEESFTSKVSFLDGESVRRHRTHLGKRIRRGLFRSSKGILMTADVNSGYNIGRKAVPEAFNADGIEGVGLHPYSVLI